MAILPNVAYIHLSGSGAQSHFMWVKKEKEVVFGPKNVRDPKLRYSAKERLEHYLLKEFNGRPFDFLSEYERFVVKYKSVFYINIFKKLHSKLAAGIKSVGQRKPKLVLNKYNKFSPLKEEIVDKFSFNYTLNTKDKISFGSFSPKVKKSSIKGQFKKLVNLCKLSKNMENKKTRNMVLLNRLRNLILELKVNRLSKLSKYNLIEKINRRKDLEYKIINFNNNLDRLQNVQLEAQMNDAGAHGENECPKIESLSNTLNEASRDASRGLPAKKVAKNRKRYHKLASAEMSPDYSQLTDRFYPYKTYPWKTENSFGDKIVDLTLPLDFVVNNPNSPNCTLFSSYAYWDGDIEVKIMLNSSKFHIGQLQMAWYYAQDYEKNFGRRDSVFSASQQAHCLISAASSNEGIIYIPFRYYKPMMGTKMRDDDPGHLNMGRLSVRVLNRLNCPSKVYKACNFTLSYRFINSTFSGMVARDLGSLSLEPQMFNMVKAAAPKLVKAALSLLDEQGDDPERDNPIDIRPPNHMVPWSAHSWSIGDNCPEPSNPLRLIATGQTPHPAEVVPSLDEMTVSYISNVFGLIDIIPWNANFRVGKLLFSYPGSPQFNNKHYRMVTYDQSVCYYLPPVAVLANMFAYWRGSLEFRLDVIASQYHTGRIIVGYIPRVLTSPTLEQLKSSPHAIFDLQGESTQFLFRVPYIADRPWWHTQGNGVHNLPPSYVYCMVMNELVPMDQVWNEVDINIYFRACEDFELAVPVVPRIGLSTYNATFIPSSNALCSTKPGYTPLFVGSWRYVNDSKANVLRYSNVTDEVVQFVNLVKGKIYQPNNDKNGDTIKGFGDSITWYIVGANVDVVNNMCPYAIYFKSLSGAKLYVTKGTYFDDDIYTRDSAYFDYTKGGKVSGIVYFSEVKDTVVMEGNMDERTNVQTCTDGVLPLVQGTNSGMFTFGEDFGHLKTLCRRYQLYDKSTFSAIADGCIQIPVLPQGIVRSDKDLKTHKTYNLCREGIIPIIASGFRFYRGGLRFRLVWHGDVDTIIRIEHLPDKKLNSMYTLSSLVGSHGCAIVLQDTKVNKVIEFEVPFYQCGMLGFLQNPKIADNLESYHFSLGELRLIFDCKVNTHVDIDLYYKLADDCKFYVFQGFPPMMHVPVEKLEANMFTRAVLGKEGKQALADVSASAASAKSVLKKLDQLLPEQAEEVTPVEGPAELKQVEDSLFSWITDHVPAQIKSIMITFVSQLVHCVINPCIKTICWSLASFLASVGFLCSEAVIAFTKALKKVVEWLQCGTRGISTRLNETKQSDAIRMEANMVDTGLPQEVKASLVGAVVASISAGLCCATRVPKNIPDFTKGIWDNLGKFSFTANHLSTFFKNNLQWIMKAYHWVIRKVFKDRALAAELNDSSDAIKEFAQEALELVDESNSRKVEVHPKWNMRVYACAARAGVLLMKLSSESTLRSPALIHLCRTIIAKRDELVKFVLSPPVKFEPYVLAICGDTNIGKSHICQNIGKNLLRSIDYKSYEEIIFTRTPGNEYWNGLRNQPICLYDDYLAIDDEYGVQQAADLFCLKSRCVFNPPQAAIEEKHIRYNPLLVFLAMNDPFPKVASVRCETAFYRRRDIMIKAVKNEAFYKLKNVDLTEGSPKSFKRDEIKNYEHLLFGIFNSVTVDKEKDMQCLLTYDQLVEEVQKRFKEFYENEMEQYLDALRTANEFYPDDDDLITGSFEEVASKIEKNCADMTKLRHNDICDYKQFLISNAATITSKDDKRFPILKRCINDFKKLNKNDHKYILDANPLFKDLEANMSEGKSGPSKHCKHSDITIAFNFTRSDPYVPGKGTIPYGEFECPYDDDLNVSEEPCEQNECVFKDDAYQREFYDKWLNLKTDCIRLSCYKRCDYPLLPGYLIKKRIVELATEAAPFKEMRFEMKATTKTRKLWKKICDEITDITKWCGSMLAGLGKNMYTVLKWALRVTAIVSSMLALFGMARNKLYPERKTNMENKFLVDNGVFYDSAFQGTAGGLDAMTVINAELVSGKHYSQTDYPSSTVDEGQMTASGDYKTFGAKSAPVRDIAIKMVANLAKEQEQAIYRLIQRNTLFIRAEYGTTMLIGRVIGLVDHYALSVDHYHDKFSKLPADARVYITDNRKLKLSVNYKDLIYKKLKDSSLGFYKLPLQVPAFKNLLKHMARQRDHRNIGPSAILAEPQCDSEVMIVNELLLTKINGEIIPASNGFEEFVVPDGYKYAKGGRGMCGSLLISSHLQRPIIGIHVAGDVAGRVGISEAICYETFSFLEDDIRLNECYEPNMGEFDDSKYLAPNSCVQVLGVIDKRFAHRESGNSKVIPTECSGQIFPVYCEPPVLSHKDERIANDPFSPMLEGVKKHGIVPLNFPPEFVELAYNDLNRLILAKVKPVRMTVGKLSKAVSIVGDPNVEGFQKLDYNTSEGCPFVTLRPKGESSKRWMFNLEQQEDGTYVFKGMDDVLRTVCKSKKMQRLRRELPFTIFTDCLKDRKLPKEKVLTPGKVRIFSISPVDFTIQARQYFMDFTVSYQNSRFDAEHAIGIDVNSIEWTELALSLLSKGTNIGTIDYRNYGPSLMAIIAQKAVQIIRNWYKFNGDNNPENDLMREMMGYEQIHSVHLVFNVLYRTLCGLPSGGPLTVILNSLVNCMYIRVAWLDKFSSNLNFIDISIKVKDVEYMATEYLKLHSINASMESFHKHVKFDVYGDDVIIAFSDAVSPVFNCIEISDSLIKYRIDITNSTKGNEMIKYLPLVHSDTNFLKSNFIPHPYRQGVFLAGLDKKSIEDTLNWTFKEWQHQLRQISLEASDACIRNAFGRGPEYFNYIRNSVFNYWLRKGENMLTPTWEEIDNSNFF